MSYLYCIERKRFMPVTIKSFSVTDNNGEQGDMFYIEHISNNFTIIDCCLNKENKKLIMDEVIGKSSGKNVVRFISTHPDEDHICGLKYLDERIKLLNFYCTNNEAKKKQKLKTLNIIVN